MNFTKYILTLGLIGIFFFLSGCNKKDKWKPVPFPVKKQESIYYSEMVSGNLDSTAKSELEEVKKITTEKMNRTIKKKNKSLPPNRKDDSIWQEIQNLYNWFLDLF